MTKGLGISSIWPQGPQRAHCERIVGPLACWPLGANFCSCKVQLRPLFSEQHKKRGGPTAIFIVLSRGCQKTKLHLIPGGASAPPDPPNKSAWRPPKCWICIGFLIQFQHLGGLQADLMGGSGGSGCPPRNQVKFRLLAAPGQYG